MMDDRPEIVLDVEQVSTHIRTEAGVVHAVDDISFTIDRGEAFGVVGESGSGKSMLARTILGIAPLDAEISGSIRLSGADLMNVSAKQRRAIWGHQVGVVFQDPSRSMNPVMRVGRQLSETMQVNLGLDKRDALERGVALLDLVGIHEPRNRMRAYPHELSGGMRQRVSIALAIACNPNLLIADEPTTALDVTIQHQVLDVLGELCDRNRMAMLLITHDIGVVASRTSRCMVVYGGRLMESGPTDALLTRPHHPYTAALIRAVPRLDGDRPRRLHAIPGRPKSVLDPSPGCRFADRCSFADEICRTVDPPVTRVDSERSLACFHPIDLCAEKRDIA